MPETKPLPLYPGAKPCINSGYCCKQMPCQFGEATSEKDRACKFLEPADGGKFVCGIYEEIIGSPGWKNSPAFGAGCCSPLNSDRLKLHVG